MWSETALKTINDGYCQPSETLKEGVGCAFACCLPARHPDVSGPLSASVWTWGDSVATRE